MPSIFELAQAVELTVLVEMEARWENLRGQPANTRTSQNDLTTIQQFYEQYHTRLVAYNQGNKPEHIPELLINTPSRLARWCAKMCDLFQIAEGDSKAQCPVNVVEKTYRRAESIAKRLGRTPPLRRTPPKIIQTAIEDLRAVEMWCAARDEPTAIA
jgi:hypothetical protein